MDNTAHGVSKSRTQLSDFHSPRVVETSSDTPLEHRGLASVSEVISRSLGNSMDAELSFHIIGEGCSVVQETVHVVTLLSVFTHGAFSLGPPWKGRRHRRPPWRFPKHPSQENGQPRRAICWVLCDLHVVCGFQAFS